jgi:hypothetical protein
MASSSMAGSRLGTGFDLMVRINHNDRYQTLTIEQAI